VKLKDSLTSEDMSQVQQARKELAVTLLESGYFDLQRDLIHAIRRYRDYSPDHLDRFLGFIGEDDALLLSESDFNLATDRVSSTIVPNSHFSARVFLTNWPNEVIDLEQVVSSLATSGEEIEAQASDVSLDWDGEKPSFETWVANRTLAAEEGADPFGAAWALRQVMMGLSAKGEDVPLTISDEEISLAGWVQDYILTALHAANGSGSDLAQNMVNRRRLAASALRLAGHACSGQSHVSHYNDEDPISEWLDHTWLLTTKLQLALLGFEGTCELAAQKAASAVQELGLDDVSPNIPDDFNPFAFGFGGEDLGVVLTLSAILQVLSEGSDELPSWWNDEVRDAVENLPVSPPPKSEPEVESEPESRDDVDRIEWGNRLDLKVPFSTYRLRRQILDLTSRPV
jgi:hypothetical protein